MSSIEDKLLYLQQTKSLIKDAIENKGQIISDTDTFRSYVDKINDIDTGNGEVRLFKSLDELTSSTNNKEGDIALIYNDNTTPLSLDQKTIGPFTNSVSLVSNFKEITFSNTLTSGGESIVYDSDVYGAMGSFEIRIERTKDYLWMYACEMMSSSFCTYSSTDGKTYTLTTDDLPEPEPLQINATYNLLLNDVEDKKTYNKLLSLFNPKLIGLKQFKNNTWVDLPSQLDDGEQYLLDGKTYMGKSGVITGLGGIYNELSSEKLYKAYINSENTKTGYECQILDTNEIINNTVATNISGFLNRYKLDNDGNKFIRVFRLGGSHTTQKYNYSHSSFIDDGYLYLNNTLTGDSYGGILKINLITWDVEILTNDNLKKYEYDMTVDRNLKNIYLFNGTKGNTDSLCCINYETGSIYTKNIPNMCTISLTGSMTPLSKNYLYYYVRTGDYPNFTSKLFRISKKFYEDSDEPEQICDTITSDTDYWYVLSGIDYISGFNRNSTYILFTQEDDEIHTVELLDTTNSKLNITKQLEVLYPFDGQHFLIRGNLINKDTFEVSLYTGTDTDVFNLLKNEQGYIGNNYNEMNMNINHLIQSPSYWDGTILMKNNEPIRLCTSYNYTQYPHSFYCYKNRLIEVTDDKYVCELYRVSECNNTEPADFIVSHNQSQMDVDTKFSLVYLLNNPPQSDYFTEQDYLNALETAKDILG